MKILLCTSVFESTENGPAKFAKIMRELDGNGDVELHVLTEDVSLDSRHVHRMVKLDLGVLSFPVRLLANALCVRQLIKQHDFDVIWYNNAMDACISSYMSSRACHIGMINDCNSARVCIDSYGLSKKYVRHKLFGFIEKHGLGKIDRLVVNSRYLFKVIRSNYKLKKERISVLYKSVDTSEVLSRQRQRDLGLEKKIQVLFVKSDFIRGGFDDLVTALTMLKNQFEVSVVGANQDSLRLHVRKISIGKNVSIDFCGLRTQEEVFQMMLTHDIFCTPSRREALGVANIEALLHSIPVVYTDTGGIPEVMDDGKNGFCAEPGNPSSLARAFQRCINNRAERIEKSLAGRKFVMENFNKETMKAKVTSISKEVLVARAIEKPLIV